MSEVTPAEALAVLSAAFKADPSYAWSWHCNIACCVSDEQVDHATANRAAARFMKLAFGVDTRGADPSEIKIDRSLYAALLNGEMEPISIAHAGDVKQSVVDEMTARGEAIKKRFESLQSVAFDKDGKLVIVPPFTPITVEEAKKLHCCRLCGGRDMARVGDPFVYNFGKEYAHQKCIDGEHEAEVAAILRGDLPRKPCPITWTTMPHVDEPNPPAWQPVTGGMPKDTTRCWVTDGTEVRMDCWLVYYGDDSPKPPSRWHETIDQSRVTHFIPLVKPEPPKNSGA